MALGSGHGSLQFSLTSSAFNGFPKSPTVAGRLSAPGNQRLSLGELAALGVALQLGARQDVLWWRGLVGCSGREDNIGIQGMRCSGWAPSVGVAGVGMSSGLCILGAARAANLAARAANLAVREANLAAGPTGGTSTGLAVGAAVEAQRPWRAPGPSLVPQGIPRERPIVVPTVVSPVRSHTASVHLTTAECPYPTRLAEPLVASVA